MKIRALDRDGNPFELEADDLLAICIQHEMDHPVGKLFIDYLAAETAAYSSKSRNWIVCVLAHSVPGYKDHRV